MSWVRVSPEQLFFLRVAQVSCIALFILHRSKSFQIIVMRCRKAIGKNNVFFNEYFVTGNLPLVYTELLYKF